MHGGGGFPGLWLLCTLLLLIFGKTVGWRSDCETAVKEWAAEQLRDYNVETKTDVLEKQQLTELLYFLHVPRTGGRTFYQCFLRNMYSKEQRCPRSYDKLRFDPRHPDCKLLTTHDDYSILTKLSKEMTSVVTNLRHPFDRVLSTYEFSIEVAARYLSVVRNQTMARGKTGAVRSILKASPISTLDIWPWKFLVPWMREDLFKRRDARNAGLMAVPTEIQNFYNVSSIAMPLQDFIHDQETFDLVHNGATFQVAGLTNNSFLEEAKKIRVCVMQHPELGIHVLRVAKMRLNKMLYVGLTERHEESATAFATIVGAQAFSQWVPANWSSTTVSNNQSQVFEGEKGYQKPYFPSASPLLSSLKQQQDVVKELLDTYHSCVMTLRGSQTSRKTLSLKNISPVKFSAEVRRSIPNSLVTEILHLNSLDVELYEHAMNLFEKQQASLVDPSRFLVNCPLCNTIYSSVQGRHESKATDNGLAKQLVGPVTGSRVSGTMVAVTGMGVIVIGMVMVMCFNYQIRMPWMELRVQRQKIYRSSKKRLHGRIDAVNMQFR